jgi:hypothetical protein
MEPAPPEEFPDWAKLPKKMQQDFFELAEKEARKIKTRILGNRSKIVELGKKLKPKFENVRSNDEWKKWRVCMVDGTESLAMSERVGARFGAYGATYHIFEGMDLVGEDYYSGQLVDMQFGDPASTQKILSLLTLALERDIALDCLQKNIDLLIVDGSFFGFRPQCHAIHNHKIPHEEYRDGAQLVKHIRDASIKLIESGKAVGIIKRVQSAALDGWSIKQNGNNQEVLHRNDRHILASLLKEKQFFSYESLFENPTIFNYYMRLALAYERYARDKKRTIESIFKACTDDVDRNIKRNLLCEPNQILTTSRHFVRCSIAAPPFCFETPTGHDIDCLLAYFQATCNKATGLPIQLDLTDEDITMPAGFTQEFTEEIEANLLKDPDLEKLEIENHFASLNPQKSE